jgi:hypothetical protein
MLHQTTGRLLRIGIGSVGCLHAMVLTSVSLRGCHCDDELSRARQRALCCKKSIRAIGAQLPCDLGVAEANAALYLLLDKPVAPYISIASLGVTQSNLLSALDMVTKQPSSRNLPPPVMECEGVTSR